jgi:hypothetical protein
LNVRTILPHGQLVFKFWLIGSVLTGEEDEDVELDLRGAKLFVKRGDNPFSDGMLGHIKLLSNKTTLDERLREPWKSTAWRVAHCILVFRREPLWKVSMNIRMHSNVHCTFDEEENALRLVLKEFIEEVGVPKKDWRGEVVVYALKVRSPSIILRSEANHFILIAWKGMLEAGL